MGAGASSRFYSDVLFRHDVILLGPGQFGPYDPALYTRNIWHSDSGLHCLRRLVKEMKAGDIVVLREGQRVVGIGVVANDDYQWNESFGDLYGWDLHHSRRVIWQDHLREDLAILQPNNTNLFGHMKQIPSLTRLSQESILSQLTPLFERTETRDLRALPPQPSKILTLPEVGERLYAKGLSNNAVDQVILALERHKRLLSWYGSHGGQVGRPTEHEVVAHLVLPILLALGWSEQLLAIEWNKIDLAGFISTPTDQDSCGLVCEAKTADHGLQWVVLQAIGYTKKLSLINCRKILVTQGGRFFLYERSGSEWDEIAPPVGYINLSQIRESYSYPENTNAIETLVGLTPAGILK